MNQTAGVGTYKRNKAVKLIEPPERAFLEPLAEMLAVQVGGEVTHD